MATFEFTSLAIPMEPPIRALKDTDVAFIPVISPYTMSRQEATDAVPEFYPKVVYPCYDRGSAPAVFASALKDSGIDVGIRDWYE